MDVTVGAHNEGARRPMPGTAALTERRTFRLYGRDMCLYGGL